MDEPITILFAGGGTGGHLYPGIAVAQALRESMPNARPLFLCTGREIDKVILEPTGFEFLPQPIVPIARSMSGLLRFWRSYRETRDLVRKVIRERRPAAALGLGGYAAGVAVRESAARKIPCALINPDVVPGKANQFLMKRVRSVCCQFEATAEHVSPADREKLQFTGCPIRPDIRALSPRDEAAARLSLDPRKLTLVVTGASLGARTVNEAVLTMLEEITLRGWQVLHLSGREQADAVREGYRRLAQRAAAQGDATAPLSARIIDFTPAMADVWAVADLAISRSGASSCAELTACGVPSLLMPYPYHKDMHQRLNAKVLADVGAAVLIDDEKDPKKNARKLRPIVESLLFDADKRRAMSEAAVKLGKPDAAAGVARVLQGLIAA